MSSKKLPNNSLGLKGTFWNLFFKIPIVDLAIFPHHRSKKKENFSPPPSLPPWGRLSRSFISPFPPETDFAFAAREGEKLQPMME